jgi:carbamoyltransferase
LQSHPAIKLALRSFLPHKRETCNPGSAPRIILGMSVSHDTGAVILRDGEIIAAINEERLTRVKQAVGAPLESVAAVLECAGISAREVDAVALSGRIALGDMPVNSDFSLEDGSISSAQRMAEAIDALPGGAGIMRSPIAIAAYRFLMPHVPQSRVVEVRNLLQQQDFRLEVAGRLRRFDHHDAHLASAYYASGESDCLVISNDAFGDGLCCKVAVGKAGRLTVIAQNSFPNSIGCYYSYATALCGFRKGHHAGKTTGLAAFGDPADTVAVFRKLFGWDERRGRYVNHGPIFGRALKLMKRELAGVSRENIAAGIQLHTQDVLVAMVRHFMAVTGLRKVVLVGGLHANVRANQCIAEIENVERLFVYPNMGDGGLAAGAAWLAWVDAQRADIAMPLRMEHVYLGSDISAEIAAESLDAAGLSVERPPNMAQAVARRLAADKIVARASGPMEFGPRALGNRSILYGATDPHVNKWLNDRLKRTEFMPFAPVCRDVDANAFFGNVTPATEHTAEFMTITFNATERCKEEAPAVVHVDGTARPQIIRREVNPDYYDILTEYNRLTGLSILVNTSFNMHEEPIVCTAPEAIAAFFESKIDCLILGPFLADNPNNIRN